MREKAMKIKSRPFRDIAGIDLIQMLKLAEAKGIQVQEVIVDRIDGVIDTPKARRFTTRAAFFFMLLAFAYFGVFILIAALKG
jgi:hypothetical protein